MRARRLLGAAAATAAALSLGIPAATAAPNPAVYVAYGGPWCGQTDFHTAAADRMVILRPVVIGGRVYQTCVGGRRVVYVHAT